MESEAATGVPVNQKEGLYKSSQTPPGQGRWTTDLCDCFSDIPLCCLTCWCPCITFGRIAEIVDKGATTCGTAGALYGLLLTLVGCQCIYSCSYRSKMKAQYGMESNGTADCCVHCWCESCALCQEYRELQNRGYDPALGWLGNMEKQSQGIGMVPPVASGGMSR